MPSLLIENVKAVPKMNVKLKTGVASDFTQLLWDFSDLDQNYIRVTKNDHERPVAAKQNNSLRGG